MFLSYIRKKILFTYYHSYLTDYISTNSVFAMHLYSYYTMSKCFYLMLKKSDRCVVCIQLRIFYNLFISSAELNCISKKCNKRML